jgi:hypothetical protein
MIYSHGSSGITKIERSQATNYQLLATESLSGKQAARLQMVLARADGKRTNDMQCYGFAPKP